MSDERVWTVQDSEGVRYLTMPDGNQAIITLGRFDMTMALWLRALDEEHWSYAELARLWDIQPVTVRKRFSRARSATRSEIAISLPWPLTEEEQSTTLGTFAMVDAMIRQGHGDKVNPDERHTYDQHMAYYQTTDRVLYKRDDQWLSRPRRPDDGPGPFVRE